MPPGCVYPVEREVEEFDSMIFEPGNVIGGRYEIKKKLGQGGVGVVYLLYDSKRERELAIKVLKPEVAQNRLAIERFKREVKAMRQVDHPGMVQVYDTGTLGDALFYTMDYVEGSTISALIKSKKRFEVDEAISLMAQICDLFEKIHEVAVHRDISSDNLMVDPGGSVHVLDFGTARLITEDSLLTMRNLHLGKICYSAPEQRADSRSVDQRADLYSLGVLLFEMLTGELIIECEPVSRYRPELDSAFDDFFEKALAQNPDDRFVSVAELRSALDGLSKRV